MSADTESLSERSSRLMRVHRCDALADTNEAYSQWHGWELTCLWCGCKVRGKRKRDALALMQLHYDQVCGEGCEIRCHRNRRQTPEGT